MKFSEVDSTEFWTNAKFNWQYPCDIICKVEGYNRGDNEMVTVFYQRNNPNKILMKIIASTVKRYFVLQ